MNSSLSNHIVALRFSSNGASERLLVKRLEEIDKYFNEDKEKAFLIGHLFATHKAEFHSDSNRLKPINEYFDKQGLSQYFEAKRTIAYPGKARYNWVILLFAILLTILGIVRLVGMFVEVGLSNIYNIPIVREGGFPLMIGIMLLFVVRARYRYSIKRTQILYDLGVLSEH